MRLYIMVALCVLMTSKSAESQHYNVPSLPRLPSHSMNCILTECGPASTWSHAAERYDTPVRTWRPPQLRNPQTITVSGSGHKSIRLSTDEDYVVSCGNDTIDGNIWITGGRNIVVRDCKINMRCAPETRQPNSKENAALKLTSFTGTHVSFENLYIDAADCIADAVVVNKKSASSPRFDTYFYNSRIMAGNGIPDGLHADIFQDQNTQADLHHNLYIENFEGGSWYSGFTAFYADSTYARNVSIVNNRSLGKRCVSKVAAASGAPSICKFDGLSPVIDGETITCAENVYVYGHIIPSKKVFGKCITNDPKPRRFVKFNRDND